MPIILQDGQRIGEYFGADGTFTPIPMPIVGANKKPITITNTGVIKPTPTAEEKANRRQKGEVWDEITKTWKKIDESGIINRAIDLFSPDKTSKQEVTIEKGKVIIDDKKNKDNTLYYVLGSALIVTALYVAYKKLR